MELHCQWLSQGISDHVISLNFLIFENPLPALCAGDSAGKTASSGDTGISMTAAYCRMMKEDEAERLRTAERGWFVCTADPAAGGHWIKPQSSRRGLSPHLSHHRTCGSAYGGSKQNEQNPNGRFNTRTYRAIPNPRRQGFCSSKPSEARWKLP